MSDESRSLADRARSLPMGASVSEGRLSMRTFEPGLIQDRGKHGYLVLRESYVAPEFMTVHVARFRQFGNRGRKAYYSWIQVDGEGVKVERTEYKPANLFERETPDSESRDLDEFRSFAESIRVSGS